MCERNIYCPYWGPACSPGMCPDQTSNWICDLFLCGMTPNQLSHALWNFYLFIFRERGREGERGGEKHQCVVSSFVPPTGDLAHNEACALTGNRTSDPLVLSWCSIHWATPARATCESFNVSLWKKQTAFIYRCRHL